jgi:crossover junction endodeoxyribonuclease RuvC
MRVLGIDPGLATVGIGIIDSDNSGEYELVDWFTIETPKGLSLPSRLLEIQSDLLEVIKKYKPDLAAVEKLYFEVNRKTAIDVAQARGVIIVNLEASGIPIIEPTPLELKSTITGDGHADKKQMQDMIEITLGEKCTSDDAADALGLAIYGVISHGSIGLLADVLPAAS